MYVLIGSQFENITVMRLEIQPDPVSQRHFQSPTCRFSKNLDKINSAKAHAGRDTCEKKINQSIQSFPPLENQ